MGSAIETTSQPTDLCEGGKVFSAAKDCEIAQRSITNAMERADVLEAWCNRVDAIALMDRVDVKTGAMAGAIAMAVAMAGVWYKFLPSSVTPSAMPLLGK